MKNILQNCTNRCYMSILLNKNKKNLYLKTSETHTRHTLILGDIVFNYHHHGLILSHFYMCSPAAFTNAPTHPQKIAPNKCTIFPCLIYVNAKNYSIQLFMKILRNQSALNSEQQTCLEGQEVMRDSCFGGFLLYSWNM